MGRTPFRAAPRSSFVAAFAALFALNAGGWMLYGERSRPTLAASRTGEAIQPRGHGPSSGAFVTLSAALPTRSVGRTDRLIVALDGINTGGNHHGPEVVGELDLELGDILDAPFTIEPPLGGSWEWKSPTRMVFLLDEPLGECMEVVMRPTAALEKLLGLAVDPDFEARWTSDPLEVQAVHVNSLDSNIVNAQLMLNTEVDPTEVLAGLKVTLPGSREALPLTPVSLPHSATESGLGRFFHGFSFPRPKGRATHVEVYFDHPLCHWGEAKSAGPPDPKLLTLPRRFAVLRQWESTHSDRAGGRIDFELNRAIEPTAEPPLVDVIPAVPHLSARSAGMRLVVEGDFEAGTTYSVRLPENLLAENGETLGASNAFQVEMPARNPRLHIPVYRGTMSPKGHLSVELQATAVNAVRVTARKVLPGNLVEHVRGTSRRYTSAEVLSETFALPTSPEDGPAQRHVLDLRGLLEREGEALPGVYDLRVASTDSHWTSDSATIRISDLGTTAKRDADGLHLWVNSIATGAAVGNATITALTVQDQTLGRATTNRKGYAFIECPQTDSARRSGDTAPFLAVIETATDTAYLELASSTWDVPRAIARGREVPALADVFAYTERNLYRPGDRVHLTGIARSTSGVVHARPIDVTLTRPDGAVMLEKTATPDPGQGLFHLSHATPQNARTGTWRFSFRDHDTAAPIGSMTFDVEAFLPARMEVVSTSEPGVEGTPPTSSVVVRSLAGTSTEGFEAELETRWSPLRFKSSRFPLFSFELAKDERSVQWDRTRTTISADGTAKAEMPGMRDLKPGLWRGTNSWDVTEPGSRSAVAQSSVHVDTAAEHRGLRVDHLAGLAPDASAAVEGAGSGVVRIREPFQVLGIAVGPDDVLRPTEPLFVSLDRVESGYELHAKGSRMRWSYVTRMIAVASVALEPDGPGLQRATLACPTEGEYRLTLRGTVGTAATILRFHAAEDPGHFQPTRKSEDVQLTPAFPAVTPGDTIGFHIESPLDGSALITAEDGRLRWQKRIQIENGRADVEVPMPDDVRGGLVVSCQVTRPLNATAETWRPHRAYGWARVESLSQAHLLDVQITAPERVRPGELATVNVEAPGSPRAAVHLWAVDEGLRLAGGHRTPDPLEHFLGRRLYRGDTTDTWSTLLPDLELPAAISRIGGDSGLASEARRRAPEEVRVVPAIVWNEAVLLGDSGRMTTTLRVPDFTGELTWMAVVVDGDRYGSSDTATTVAGEIPMSLGLPRFAAPGDRMRVKVAFENTVDTAASVRPRLELEGAAEILEAPDDVTITLEPGERHVAWFTVEATRSGRIEGAAWLEGEFADGRAVLEEVAIDLPVRSGRPFVTASSSLHMDASAGHSLSLDLVERLGVDASEREDTELRVSASSGLALYPAGAYLTGYPHGCAEQTASRIYAALSMHALRAEGDDAETALMETTDRVERGFLRLATMQVGGGGIGYWPGSPLASNWASLHVAEVIAAAKDLGFDVPSRLVTHLSTYLDQELRLAKDGLERARLVHAAAALGTNHAGWMRRLEEQQESLGRSGRAALAAALALAGESERALALIESKAVEADTAPGATSTYLDSIVRTAALELRVLLSIAPHHPGVVNRVSLLESERSPSRGRWRNTVDNAAALAALAKYAQMFDEQDADWRLTAQLGDSGLNAIEVTSETTSTIPVPADILSVEVDLTGYGPAFLTVSATGRRSASAPGADHGLVCRRQLFDRDGEELDTENLRHGDLIFVAITLKTDGRSIVPDVAIVDPLPAGFEIETPKLLTDLPWESEEDRTEAASRRRSDRDDRVEFLDDRVLVYATAAPQAREFHYAVRVVGIGSFEHGPVQAEAMYAPEISSVGGSVSRIRVQE